MDRMNMHKVKTVTRSDKPTENYHQTLISISSAEHLVFLTYCLNQHPPCVLLQNAAVSSEKL